VKVATRHTERSKSVINVHNVHKRRGYRACLVNVVNIENKRTTSATGGALVAAEAGAVLVQNRFWVKIA
jgi:hypothetical protein